MEFTCVFSVGDSLASYLVKQESERTYTASLRTASVKQPAIPTEIFLEGSGDGWKAMPPHEEIARNLVLAIEAGGQIPESPKETLP